jgi:septum formation protein
MIDLILASASPRRKELLEQIAVKFSCSPMNINEDRYEQEGALDYVQRLAQEKALAALPQASGLAVLGSDTIVVLGGNILGKPKDSFDARQMLAMLSGQSHQVITGISLCRMLNGKPQILNEVVTTQVTFEPLTREQIAAYVEAGESLDKAGSYGIQGKAAAFIKSIQGSYSNVVGLPLYETSKLLAAFDVPIWTD